MDDVVRPRTLPFAALTMTGNSGESPGLTRSGVGDDRVAGPLSLSRLGKEIREVEPEPEDPVSEPSRV